MNSTILAKGNFTMNKHGVAILVISLVLLLSVSLAFGLQPPRPGEIEHLKQTGEYADRLDKAKAIGNHLIDKDRLDQAIYKARRQALIQQGMNPDEILPAPPPAKKLMPTTGNVKIFALLIDFDDYPATDGYSTQPQVHSALFGDGSAIASNPYPYESLKNYYERSSYNQLHFDSGVTLGWYRAGYTRASMGLNPTTAQRETLIKEAIAYFKTADPTLDFSQFNNDTADSKIELFIVLWTGPNNGWSNFWWAYQTSWTDSAYTVDGMNLGKYVWQWAGDYGNMVPFEPYVAVHEVGHGLGLPDYYDYDGTIGPDGGVGSLDMMHGNWGDHNSFSKWVLEWITPSVVASGSQTLTLNPSGTSQDAVLIMPGATSSDAFREFFIAQNRYRVGNDPATNNSVNNKYPTDGMLIWHVDARLNTAGTDYAWDNSYTGHKLLKLMEADGLERIEGSSATVDAAMYYTPGETLGPVSAPSSRDYAGVDTGVHVIGISQSGQQMTATFSIDDPRILPTLTIAKSGNGSGTVTSDLAGIDCGSDCQESYTSGTVVTLTAAAASGVAFTGWSGGGCSGTGTCTVTLTADTTVTATFTTTLLLNQDFSGCALPTGWTRVITTGVAWWWFNYTDTKSGGTGCYALGATYGAGPFDIALKTTAVNLTAYNSVGLEFKTHIGGNDTSIADVDVSLNSGSTWTNVWHKVGRFTGPQTINVDLSSIAGNQSSVMLQFHTSGTAIWFDIDDVKIMARPTHTVTATATGSGSGTVSSSLGGINYSYPPDATGTTSPLDYGTAVTLTATAAAGSTASWTTCSGTSSGNGTLTATCSYTSLDGNKTAEATFTISDGIAPVTTATPSSYTFGNWTNAGSVSVSLSAVDTGGSGVASGYPKYCIDTADMCDPSTSGTSLNVICSSGAVCTQYVRYYSADVAGNVETVKSSQVTQDLQLPDTSISAQPTNPATSTSASFSFSGDDGTGSGVASFECQLDSAGFGPCTSPQAYSSLGQGSHIFEIRAIDIAGNADSTPATYTWIIDSIAPNAPTVTATTPTYDTRPTWHWSTGGGGNGTYRYQLNGEGGAWTETGSLSFTPASPLAAGSYTLYVQERDAAGNWSVSGSKLIQINASTSATWSLVNGAMETCVNNAGQLQSSLSDAETDGYPNVIKVVQGSYVGLFAYAGNEDFDLTLQGGYNAGCTARTINPTLTILDGDTDLTPDGIGNGVTLDMAMLNPNSTGSITVDGFTVINGYNGYDDGGCIRIFTDAGQTTVTGNIVHNCVAITGGGIGVETVSGKALITNNIVHHNIATLAGGGINAITSTGGVVILNNTVSDNEATDVTNGTGGGLSVSINSDTGTAEFINNIIRGNIVNVIPGTCADISIESDGDGNSTHAVVTLHHNDANLTTGICASDPLFTIDPTNMDVDPVYVNAAAGDYHIQNTSPCKDTGDTTDPDLPARDIDGHTRVSYGIVDIGADEVAVPAGAPATVSVPQASTSGIITLSWSESVTAGVTYVVEESTSPDFTTALTQVYSGPLRTVTLSGRVNGTYYYRVKAIKEENADSVWRDGGNGCTVIVKAIGPTWIYVPASSNNGSIYVYWGTTPTPGGSFELEESKDGGAYANVYSGSNRSVTLTGRTNGAYSYRVRVVADGYNASDWRTGGNSCVVSIYVYVPPAVGPTWIYVPGSSSNGSIYVYWGTMGTPGGSFELEESKDGGTYANVYSGSNRSVTLTGRTNGAYSYRVRVVADGYTASPWRTGGNNCVVSIYVYVPPAVGPTWIYVPASSSNGSIYVYWGTMGTPGGSFVLEESKDGGTYAGVYSGTDRSEILTGRTTGTYSYRVMVVAEGYSNSPWRTGTNSCAVP
ncbi:MAG: M6 family metalloprotease domain-containing protein [Nitrospirae bacterium]|nr:M6 family metalloprotease domain-containing protein [Nitrospirota bacterium]